MSSQFRDFEDLKNKGNNSFKAKDYEAALSSYTKAIDIKGDEAVAFSNRAQCYLKVNSYYDAKRDCDQAILLDSKYTKAYYRRALAEKELLLYQLALKDFEKVLELEPTFQLARKEIDEIKRILKEDERINLALKPELLKKPTELSSKKEVKKFHLNGQYQGSKSYLKSR